MNKIGFDSQKPFTTNNLEQQTPEDLSLGNFFKELDAAKKAYKEVSKHFGGTYYGLRGK